MQPCLKAEYQTVVELARPMWVTDDAEAKAAAFGAVKRKGLYERGYNRVAIDLAFLIARFRERACDATILESL